MSMATQMNTPAAPSTDMFAHFVQGTLEYGQERILLDRFMAPDIDPDRLIWPRTLPLPAFDLPVAEIVDVLVATGEHLARDPDGILAAALDHMIAVGDLDSGILERAYASLPRMFARDELNLRIEREIGGADIIDGWRDIDHPATGRTGRIRAFPSRLVHVLAGNTPSVAAISIIRSALTKSASLLKMPSNDLFSATAILGAMASAAPGHPVTRSFSAVYWRGGDSAVEDVLFRPQYFDKLVAWGGEASLRSAKQYIGPGFELVAFDPKTSISILGPECFANADAIAEAAERAAIDATVYDQTACTASRFMFVEGNEASVDAFCEALQQKMGVARQTSSTRVMPLDDAMCEEIEALAWLGEEFRVWGQPRHGAVVIRSPEPVDFHPEGKIVNVVRLSSIEEAQRFVDVATQTVGIHPPALKEALRNRLAGAGAQRIVSLGRALNGYPGLAHDGFLPVQRLLRWVNDED